ncbi:LPS export ABC transporter permease LptF [Limnohabitans sp.]|uniref:LPS export ABC transporter permease LptF n=1 Tax=Limnohabitans sp. TaxID=1907725 RepID=UPI00333EE930
MLFHSSIRKELARSFGATLIVLVTIVMTMMLIRTLGQASLGSVNPAEVTLILGFTMLGQLPILLTMSLFIASVGTLSRMYLESEMVIWLVSGKGLRALATPMLNFAWPMLLSVFVLMLLIWPWSNQQIGELKNRYERRGDLERVAPGQFQESASGSRVFFIDKESLDNKEGKNVFISSTDHDKQSMTSSRTGHIEILEDEQYLVLENGQRIEQNNGKPDLKITQFKSYTTQLNPSAKVEDKTPLKTVSSLELIQNPTPGNLGELGWRLGVAFSAFNVIIIALAITSANPRVGRGGNLAQALLFFVVYFNLINLGQSWVGSGKAQLLPFFIALHGGVFVLAYTWLTARHYNWNWRQLLGRAGV